MKTVSLCAVALLVAHLYATSKPIPRSYGRLTSSPLSAQRPLDWIDLGTEGSTLYLLADYDPSKRGAVELVISTMVGAQRVRLDIEADGKTHLWLYPRSVSGPAIDPSKKHKMLLKIVAHAKQADEIFVKFAEGKKIPAEPRSDAGWTLVNRTGSSNADLGVYQILGSQALRNVKIAHSYQKLVSSQKPK